MEPVLVFYGVSALVGVTAAVTKMVRSHLGRTRRLEQIASELGLSRSGNHLMGEHEGIKIGLQTHAGSPNRDGFIRLYARFEPPLDLGLCIRQTNQKPPRFGQGREEVDIGHERRFTAQVDDAARIDALISAELHDCLQPLQGPGNVIVSDTGATINAPLQATARDLVEKLEQLVALASAVQSRRTVVPVAKALAPHLGSWRAYAAQNHLTMFTVPLCMFGRIGESTVYAYAVRTARLRYELEIYLRFDVPLDLGLLLQPTRTVDRMRGLFGSEDIALGDALFDDHFTVIATNVEATRRMFDQELRERLLAVRQVLGHLTVSDAGVATRLENVPHTPTAVPTMVTQLLGLAKLIEDRRGNQRLGPYR